MDGYRWIDLGNGKKVFRRIIVRENRRSDLAIPMLVRDFSEPVQSMADGNWYSNKAALRKTYRADGNPQGVEYAEVGTNDTRTGPEHKPVTHEQAAELYDKAEAAIIRGEYDQPMRNT
jgi:hypothetical protein